MSVAINIDDGLYNQAQLQAPKQHRTIVEQIEFWALVGKTALDNPDLPVDFVRDLLIARSEDRSLATPFVPEGQRQDD